MSTQYPGPDPDDPFAKAPDESGTPAQPSGVEETAPIQREEIGYWERLAQEQAAQQPAQQPATPPAYEQNPTSAQPVTENPWAGYGEPAQPGYGDPAQPGGATPPPAPAPYGQQPYGQQPYGVPPSPYTYGYAPIQNHPQSTTALVLGLIGLIGGLSCCGLPLLLSPFAWWIGGKAKKEIDASGGQLAGRGNAQAGFVMGIIGTVLAVLAILVVGLIFILGATGQLDSSSSYDFSTDY